MPIPLPRILSVRSCQLRRASFRKKGNLTPTEELLVINGFKKTGDAVECLNCGTTARVDLTTHLNHRDIARLHSITCNFRTPDLQYVLRRAVLIRVRRPRGWSSLYDSVVLDVIRMGFPNEKIQKAAAEFFLDNGAFPDTNDLLEYILRES